MKSYFFLTLAVFQILKSKCDEVVMIYEVFRHGARTPLHNGYDSESYKIQGLLTGVGMRQHYNLGKILRKKYIKENNLLSDKYNESEIYVRSSDSTRTLESANSQLIGLYEEKGPEIDSKIKEQYLNPPFEEKYQEKQEKGDALPCGFQPIPIHTVSIKKDYLTQAVFLCPSGKNQIDKSKKTKFYKGLSERFNETLKYAGSFYSKNESSLEEAYGLMDVFQNDIYAGHQLPKNLTKENWESLEIIYDMHLFYVLFGKRNTQKVHTYKIFKSVLKNFRQKMINNSTLKAYLLSAHDDNIASLYTALNFSNYSCLLKGRSDDCLGTPGYAAQVIFELWREDGSNRFYIKVLSNGKVKSINKNEEKNGKLYFEDFELIIKNFLKKPFKNLCMNISKSIINNL